MRASRDWLQQQQSIMNCSAYLLDSCTKLYQLLVDKKSSYDVPKMRLYKMWYATRLVELISAHNLGVEEQRLKASEKENDDKRKAEEERQKFD
eukprot:9746396-Karenia_brevis.AAC.1